MKRKWFLTILVCLATVFLTLGLISCAANAYPGDRTVPGATRNEVLFIERNRLTFALGMEINDAEIIAKCGCVFTDDGEQFTVTAGDLTGGKVKYQRFDLETTGSNKRIRLEYKGAVNYIYYDVNDYTANFYLDEEQTELYKTVKAQAQLTDTLGLAVWVNLIQYNYSTDEEMRGLDSGRAERFDGWYDSSGNRATGLYSLEPPLSGNEREMSFHAHYISDEDFNDMILSYDAAGRRVFSGYTGSNEIVRIPEGVTYVDFAATFKEGAPFKSLILPSTASVDVPFISGINSSGLESIVVNAGNLQYSSYNGALYSKDYSSLYFMPADCTETSFHTGLSVIESYACAYWHVTELTLPEHISTLQHYSFAYSRIETVQGLDRIKTVKTGVFYGSKLNSVRDGVAEYIVLNGSGKYILSMVFDESITEYKLINGTVGIAGDAFGRCKNLVSIDFGDELESIGGSAFADCISLKSITFPASLKKMGPSVFYGCTALESAKGLPCVTYVDDNGKEYANTLPYGLFRGCISLVDVDVPEGIISIGQSVFYGCSALESVDVPDTVRVINAYGFYGCSAMTDIELPEGLIALGIYAFSASGITGIDLSVCKGLTALPDYCFRNSKIKTIVIPDSITTVPAYCFYSCTSLTSIDLNNVTVIEDHAFNGCSKLTVIDLKNVERIGTRTFSACTGFTEVVLPDSIKYVGGYAFASNTNLKSITLGAGVEHFGNFPFESDGLTFGAVEPALYSCSKLQNITVAEGNRYFKVIDGVLYGREAGGEDFGEGGVLYCAPTASGITDFVSAPSARVVLPYSFQAQTALVTAVFSEGLLNIGKGAFYNSKKLTTVTLPSTIMNIGASIFLGCSAITSFKIAEGNGAYSTDGNLVYNGTVLTMYLGFSSDIKIKEGTTEIASAVFMDNTKITQVVIPDSVVTIGVKAFSGCSKIVSLHIGSGLQKIDPSAFALLSSLETITVSEDNRYFTAENNILYSKDGKSLILAAANNGMTELDIKEGVTEIWDYAFSYHKTLASAIVPSTVKTIGNYAFYECRGITVLYCSEALESIGNYAFAFDTNSSSNVDSRRCCDALKTILFYGNLRTVGDFAFNGHFGIEHVFYKMTIAELELARRGFGANSVFFTLGCKDDETGGYYNNNGQGIIRALYSATDPTIDYNGYDWFYFDEDGTPTLYVLSQDTQNGIISKEK